MRNLERLINTNGVVAAAEFSPDGRLADYRSHIDMPPGMAQQTAQFCATVSMLFDTLAGAYTGLTQMQWVPQHGWAFTGGDWTVAVSGNRMVFADTRRADFNELFDVLVGPRPQPQRMMEQARPAPRRSTNGRSTNKGAKRSSRSRSTARNS